MNSLKKLDQNEFLSKWIYGKLTTKELNTFVSSQLYKNLVFSTMSQNDSKTENS